MHPGFLPNADRCSRHKGDLTRNLLVCSIKFDDSYSQKWRNKSGFFQQKCNAGKIKIVDKRCTETNPKC